MSEVEYQGIKVKGGRLFLIFPLLGTLAGAVWAGFEGYARWVAMEEKINEYVAPDLSGFNLKLEILEEKIDSLESNVTIEMSALKALELLSRVRGAKNEKADDTNMETLQEELVSIMKMLGKKNIDNLYKKCGF